MTSGLARQIIEKVEEASRETGFPLKKDSPTAQYSYKHAYGAAEEPWKPQKMWVGGGRDEVW
jgi:hypothetical protein